MTATAEVEKVARLSYGRLVALLAARTGSVSAAADALQDALERALEAWPRQGVPERPEAWLLAAARNRARDGARHARVRAAATEHLALVEEERAGAAAPASADRTLDLMFVCAHPAIDPRMRTPLMLQLVLGLDARRMSAAFLVPPATLGQRLSRARAKIEVARIGFSLPEPEEMPPRLGHVLDAIYAAFSLGTEAAGAGDAKASALAPEALWLGSIAAAGMPGEGEAQGLLALMLYTEARRPARLGADGTMIPLEEQDTSLWDARMLRDADRALAAAAARPTLGRYQIEAAIAAAHADRRHGRATDWAAVVALYRGLVALHPTVGARVGLAAATAEAGDPRAALAGLEEDAAAGAAGYQPWWAVRAHVLGLLGDRDGADAAYERATALAGDPAVRGFLARRRAGLA